MINKTPPGWKKAILSELGNWFGGGTPSKSNKDYWLNGSIAWVSPKDMNTKKINKTIDYITKEAVTGSSTKIIPKNSILFVTRSGILRNKLPIAINEIDVAINQDIKAFVPDYKIDFSYLVQYLWANESFLLKSCVKTGTTVESVDYDQLKQFSCIYPHMQEQKKIAEILSTWDQAIEKTQKLIELKEKYFFDLLHRLVNKINKEFPKRIFLEEIVEIRIGRTPARDNKEYWDIEKVDSHIWLSISDLKHNEKISTSKENITNKAIADCNMKSIPAKTVVMSFKLTLGRVSILEVPAYTNEAIAAFFPKNSMLKSEFLFYLLQTIKWESFVDQAVKGKTLNKEKLKKIKICLVPVKKQDEIVAILDILNKEIDVFKNILDRTKKQKQGLMQKLLTGEWRMPLDQETEHG